MVGKAYGRRRMDAMAAAASRRSAASGTSGKIGDGDVAEEWVDGGGGEAAKGVGCSEVDGW